MSDKGLYQKYRVIEVTTGEPVDGCFVMRPEDDRAAFEAVLHYAFETQDKMLASDLFAWLRELREIRETETRAAVVLASVKLSQALDVAKETLQFYADLCFSHSMGLPSEVQWRASQALAVIADFLKSVDD